MRIVKRVTLIAAAAMASIALAPAVASADLVEGPIEGTLEYESFVTPNGYSYHCQTQSLSGEITDGASEPATGSIDAWTMEDCVGSAGSCTMASLPYDIEVHVDGTVRIMEVVRDCELANSPFFAEAAEGYWDECGGLEFSTPFSIGGFQGIPIAQWDSVWAIEGLQRGSGGC